MSVHDNDSATGDQGNRATVALVGAKVDGLKELTKAGFSDVQRQLDRLEDLPKTVAELRAQNQDQEGRIAVLESRARGDSEWRRTHLPTILLTLALVTVAVVGLLTQVHP